MGTGGGTRIENSGGFGFGFVLGSDCPGLSGLVVGLSQAEGFLFVAGLG